METRRRWDIWLSQLPPHARVSSDHPAQGSPQPPGPGRSCRADHLRPAGRYLSGWSRSSRSREQAAEPTSPFDQPVRTHFEVYRKEPPRPLDRRRQGSCSISDELEKIESPDFWLDVDPQSGVRPPAMRKRPDEGRAVAGLARLRRASPSARERQASRASAMGSREMPGLDASPLERARYIAAPR